MSDGMRGDGVLRVEAALWGFVKDPDQLQQDRLRFDDSPPSYTSRKSHSMSTRTQSPDIPSEEQRRREDQQWKLKRDRAASLPNEQFEAQIDDEKERIIQAVELGTLRVPVGTDYHNLAYENIKKSWVLQGIWNHKWNTVAYGRWKHEEESEPDTEAVPRLGLFSVGQEAGPASTPPTSDNETQEPAGQQAVSRAEREASRPFYQFVYQLSKERDRIRGKLESREDTTLVPANINTIAYETVKNTWTKRGIWDGRWGTVPGMSWKHEWPVEALVDNNSAPAQMYPPEDSHDADRASAFQWGPSIESRYLSHVNTTMQGALGGPPGPAGSGATYSPSTSEPSNRRSRLLARRRPEPCERKRSFRAGQVRSTERLPLNPLRPSKIEKAPRKQERPGTKRARITSETLFSTPKVKVPEDSEAIPPRRSQRLQNKAKDLPQSIHPTALPQNPTRSKPRSMGALKAGPRARCGVSKRQHSKARYKGTDVKR